MNNNNLKEEVTILKTWKGETIEVDISYEDFLLMEQNTKNKGEDGFNSTKHRRFIKFSSIEDKIGKTKYIALEPPKEEYKERTPKERKEIDKAIKIALQKTYEGRKKTFLLDRSNILRELSKREKSFGLDTTESKLNEFNIMKLKMDMENLGMQ